MSLIIIIVLLGGIFVYGIRHKHKQHRLRNARDNYLMQEDHDEWIKNSNNVPIENITASHSQRKIYSRLIGKQ